MKAVLLVGGYGTRLRPLTFTRAKPTIEFCNKPIVMYLLEALKEVGCDEVIMATSYHDTTMESTVSKYAEGLNMKIHYSVEDKPLGTAGPLALARQNGLLKPDDGPFFMFNADVVCEFPLLHALEYHKSKGGEATILVTKVEEPSRFGVILSDETGRVTDFVEKPKRFVGDRINAGIYVLDAKILDRVEFKPTSIERVIFPQIAKEEKLYCFDMEGIWRDVGQRVDYLEATAMYLEFLRKRQLATLSEGPTIMGNVLVAESATIGEHCHIGPNVVIGDGCTVADGARISNSVLLPGAKVGELAVLTESAVAWGSVVGPQAHLNKSFVGEDVVVEAENVLVETHVCPHQKVTKTTTMCRAVL